MIIKHTCQLLAYLAVPVKAGLHHIGIFNAVQLDVPDAEIKTGTPGHQRHCEEEMQKVFSRTETLAMCLWRRTSEKSPTYFNKSAGEHLLVNLVLEGKRLLVVVILKATREKKQKQKMS